MRSLIGLVLASTLTFAWAAPLPHAPAMVPRVTIEPHDRPKANVQPVEGDVQIAAAKLPVTVFVVGCKLTLDDVTTQAGPVFDAFGAVHVRIDMQYLGGYDGVLCDPEFADVDTNTALQNVTGLFNNVPGWAHWRRLVGADVIIFLRVHPAHADTCGNGWQNNKLDAAYAFAVVEAGTCGEYDAYTMAHELGHVFGAGHGPKTDSVSGLYKFSNAFDGYTRKGRWLHTLMSYGFSGSPLYPRFSAPGMTRKSGRFNNKRTIQLAAPIVARFR